MTSPSARSANEVREPAPASRLRRAWNSQTRRRFTRKKSTILALVWIALVILASLVGPYFTTNPNLVDLESRLLAPGSSGHALGTDVLGRDILARVVAGARVSVIVCFVVAIIAFVAALFLGVLTGYRGGLVDDVLSRVFDVVISFPNILLGIIIVVILTPSMTSVIIALAIAYVPEYGRQIRAGVISVKQRPFVHGAVAVGNPHWRVIFYHILPTVLVPVMVIVAGTIGRIALAEASLSYLGAGVPLPNASWGNMISEGQAYLRVAPWLAIVPGTVLTLWAVAISFVGDALRDAFAVRESVLPE